MNYNPKPRDVFKQDSTQVADHHVLVENPILRRSVDTALADYARRCASSQAADLGTAAGWFLKIQGAHDLVETLYNLAESEAAPSPVDNLNLSGNTRTLVKKG